MNGYKNYSIIFDQRNSQEPGISVVIPVYNTSEYIDDCLKSLKKQTYVDFEIICINDGSTDSSLDILLNYAKNDYRIVVIQQKHSNAGEARNNGLSLAKGKYVLFLDSDDFFEKNFLEIMYNSANKNSVDIVMCGYNVFDDKTHTIISTKQISNKYIGKTIKTSELTSNIFSITNPNAWTKLFARKLIENHSIRFESLPCANDITFVCSALALANNIFCVENPLINYRINTGKNISSLRGDKIQYFMMAIQSLYCILNKKHVFNIFSNAFKKRIIDSASYELKNSSSHLFYNVKYYIPEISPVR